MQPCSQGLSSNRSLRKETLGTRSRCMTCLRLAYEYLRAQLSPEVRLNDDFPVQMLCLTTCSRKTNCFSSIIWSHVDAWFSELVCSRVIFLIHKIKIYQRHAQCEESSSVARSGPWYQNKQKKGKEIAKAKRKSKAVGEKKRRLTASFLYLLRRRFYGNRKLFCWPKRVRFRILQVLLSRVFPSREIELFVFPVLFSHAEFIVSCWGLYWRLCFFR